MGVKLFLRRNGSGFYVMAEKTKPDLTQEELLFCHKRNNNETIIREIVFGPTGNRRSCSDFILMQVGPKRKQITTATETEDEDTIEAGRMEIKQQ